MINHLGISHMNDSQFIALNNEQIVSSVKIDAGFNDLSLPVYEINSKAARINAIFEECISRVMLSKELNESQKVQRYWNLVDVFNGIRRECYSLEK